MASRLQRANINGNTMLIAAGAALCTYFLVKRAEHQTKMSVLRAMEAGPANGHRGRKRVTFADGVSAGPLPTTEDNSRANPPAHPTGAHARSDVYIDEMFPDEGAAKQQERQAEYEAEARRQTAQAGGPKTPYGPGDPRAAQQRSNPRRSAAKRPQSASGGGGDVVLSPELQLQLARAPSQLAQQQLLHGDDGADIDDFFDAPLPNHYK